jgi:hypothetical protein
MLTTIMRALESNPHTNDEQPCDDMTLHGSSQFHGREQPRVNNRGRQRTDLETRRLPEGNAPQQARRPLGLLLQRLQIQKDSCADPIVADGVGPHGVALGKRLRVLQEGIQ